MLPWRHAPTLSFFFFNDTATTEIYTLSLHDALPICRDEQVVLRVAERHLAHHAGDAAAERREVDRKSTRLNSSHSQISYAVFCLKKKKKRHNNTTNHKHTGVTELCDK